MTWHPYRLSVYQRYLCNMPSFKKNSQPSWPQDVGIVAIEIYFPSQYVCQMELEEYDCVSQGKYTIGLGQFKMGFCSDREDINSICLTVLSKLMEKTKVGYENIGRLEVGTETLIDKSKSVKSVLMQLFEESGNTDIEGIDTINACYGGTAALFNSLNWIESSSWDGRYAVVVAGDIAVYAKGCARPTGGAGAIAMLIGANAPLVIERGLRTSFMKHVYDFYKPDMKSEYPIVDGKLSIQCYFAALDSCYRGYLKKADTNTYGLSFPRSLEDFDAFAFHSPFCKLVQKSFARLTFNDFLNCPENELDRKFPGLKHFREKTLEETYFDKSVEKAFVAFSEKVFEEKTKPSLLLSSEVGNMYTPSLYSGLASILASSSAESLAGKRIGLFSYGSGLASTMFSIKVSEDCSIRSPLKRLIQAASDIPQRLNARIKVPPRIFTEVMNRREEAHGKAGHTPLDDPSILFPGTWYLTGVDELFRRQYKWLPSFPSDKFPDITLSTAAQKDVTLHQFTNGHSMEVCPVVSS